MTPTITIPINQAYTPTDTINAIVLKSTSAWNGGGHKFQVANICRITDKVIALNTICSQYLPKSRSVLSKSSSGIFPPHILIVKHPMPNLLLLLDWHRVFVVSKHSILLMLSRYSSIPYDTDCSHLPGNIVGIAISGHQRFTLAKLSVIFVIPLSRILARPGGSTLR